MPAPGGVAVAGIRPAVPGRLLSVLTCERVPWGSVRCALGRKVPWFDAGRWCCSAEREAAAAAALLARMGACSATRLLS